MATKRRSRGYSGGTGGTGGTGLLTPSTDLSHSPVREPSPLPDIPTDDHIKRVKFSTFHSQCEIGLHYTQSLINMLVKTSHSYINLSKSITKSVQEEIDNIRRFTNSNNTNTDNMTKYLTAFELFHEFLSDLSNSANTVGTQIQEKMVDPLIKYHHNASQTVIDLTKSHNKTYEDFIHAKDTASTLKQQTEKYMKQERERFDKLIKLSHGKLNLTQLNKSFYTPSKMKSFSNLMKRAAGSSFGANYRMNKHGTNHDDTPMANGTHDDLSINGYTDTSNNNNNSNNGNNNTNSSNGSSQRKGHVKSSSSLFGRALSIKGDSLINGLNNTLNSNNNQNNGSNNGAIDFAMDPDGVPNDDDSDENESSDFERGSINDGIYTISTGGNTDLSDFESDNEAPAPSNAPNNAADLPIQAQLQQQQKVAKSASEMAGLPPRKSSFTASYATANMGKIQLKRPKSATGSQTKAKEMIAQMQSNNGNNDNKDDANSPDNDEMVAELSPSPSLRSDVSDTASIVSMSKSPNNALGLIKPKKVKIDYNHYSKAMRDASEETNLALLWAIVKYLPYKNRTINYEKKYKKHLNIVNDCLNIYDNLRESIVDKMKTLEYDRMTLLNSVYEGVVSLFGGKEVEYKEMMIFKDFSQSVKQLSATQSMEKYILQCANQFPYKRPDPFPNGLKEWRTPFHFTEDLMHMQKIKHPYLEIPYLVEYLCSEITSADGLADPDVMLQNTVYTFSVPKEMRQYDIDLVKLSRGNRLIRVPTDLTPHHYACNLLKRWMTESIEPVIPYYLYDECVSFHERTLEDTRINSLKYSRNTVVMDSSKMKATLGIGSFMKSKKDNKRHSSPNLANVLGKNSNKLFEPNGKHDKKQWTTEDIRAYRVEEMNKLLSKLDGIRLKILARIVEMCNIITSQKKVKIIDLSYELAEILLRDPREIINTPMPHNVSSSHYNSGNASDSENETKTNHHSSNSNSDHNRRKSDSYKDVRTHHSSNSNNGNGTDQQHLQVDLSVIRETSISSKSHSEDLIVQSPNDKERQSKMEFVTFLLSNKMPCLDVNTLFVNKNFVHTNGSNLNSPNSMGSNLNSPNNGQFASSFTDETNSGSKRHNSPKRGVASAALH